MQRGSTRFERIVKKIEDSEKLKSSVERKGASLADAPGSMESWRNGAYPVAYPQLYQSIVDSDGRLLLRIEACKCRYLFFPLCVGKQPPYHCKGRKKFLESVSEAHTIVFDKTGTLTKAEPVLADIVVFNDMTKNEILRIAACLRNTSAFYGQCSCERSCKEKLVHEEMHSKVDYIVAHGIAQPHVNEERVVIGSHHFVFDDEKCTIPEEHKQAFDESATLLFSHLYMAIGGKLAKKLSSLKILFVRRQRIRLKL